MTVEAGRTPTLESEAARHCSAVGKRCSARPRSRSCLRPTCRSLRPSHVGVKGAADPTPRRLALAAGRRGVAVADRPEPRAASHDLQAPRAGSQSFHGGPGRGRLRGAAFGVRHVAGAFGRPERRAGTHGGPRGGGAGSRCRVAGPRTERGAGGRGQRRPGHGAPGVHDRRPVRRSRATPPTTSWTGGSVGSLRRTQRANWQPWGRPNAGGRLWRGIPGVVIEHHDGPLGGCGLCRWRPCR